MNDKPPRGRPKTLDRKRVLQIAMEAYWDDGPTSVAIGEICERAGVSKPGVYREFGSDDGLKCAVLDLYHDAVLRPMYAVLESGKPFAEVVEDFIEFTTQDRQSLALPPGCLQVSMRAHRSELGELTRNKIDALRAKTLDAYKGLAERAKASGELEAQISTEVTALFFDAQNGSAMRMQKEGVQDRLIKEVMRRAFSGFR